MSSYQVRITPTAAAEIRAIGDHIALDSPARAAAFVQALIERIQTLREMPRRCPRAIEDTRKGVELRQLLHGEYRIVFGITAGRRDDRGVVTIYAVRHGKRLPGVL
jgi:plasmid stabilization system protein ParE